MCRWLSRLLNHCPQVVQGTSKHVSSRMQRYTQWSNRSCTEGKCTSPWVSAIIKNPHIIVVHWPWGLTCALEVVQWMTLRVYASTDTSIWRASSSTFSLLTVPSLTGLLIFAAQTSLRLTHT